MMGLLSYDFKETSVSTFVDQPLDVAVMVSTNGRMRSQKRIAYISMILRDASSKPQCKANLGFAEQLC
jgi:hypothetical protein